MELILNNLVLILTVVFLVLMGIRGFSQGLLKMLTSLAGVALALFISRMLTPYLAARMEENNAWVTWVQSEVLPKLRAVTMDMVFHAVSFLVLFVLSSILIRVLSETLEKMMDEPLLSAVNQVFGMILGMAEAVIYIWVLMLFVDVMPQLGFCQTVSAQITADGFLTVLHENNLLVTFLQQIL